MIVYKYRVCWTLHLRFLHHHPKVCGNFASLCVSPSLVTGRPSPFIRRQTVVVVCVSWSGPTSTQIVYSSAVKPVAMCRFRSIRTWSLASDVTYISFQYPNTLLQLFNVFTVLLHKNCVMDTILMHGFRALGFTQLENFGTRLIIEWPKHDTQ